MIFGDGSAIRLSGDERRFVISERDTLVSLLRIPLGLFPVSIGGLVTYVFVFGEQPKPTNVAGWVIISLMVTAIGICPFCVGFNLIFNRRRFVVDRIRLRLRSQITLAGVAIFSRAFSLSSFERIVIESRRIGPFGGRQSFVVAFGGHSSQVDIARFRDYRMAEQLAADIAKEVRLPVVSGSEHR